MNALTQSVASLIRHKPAPPRRTGMRDAAGYLALEDYGALGDGRSIVLSGADGSIDWWCVPNMDSPPLFDRLLAAGDGGCFAITPVEPFTVARAYRADSNVLETLFTTASGCARLVESLNSGSAGRLPWAELARRVEGVKGTVGFAVTLRLGRRADTVNPYIAPAGVHDVFHVDGVLGLLRISDGVRITDRHDAGVSAMLSVAAGERQTLAIVAGENEPLVVPSIAEIDDRLDRSDGEWRTWCEQVRYDGPHRDLLIRNALALKLLLYSPTGAITAAATTSLPERIGGDKNYDYRYAWIRDAGYSIKAFLRIGVQAEAKAGFTWLLKRLATTGPLVCYTLDGDPVPALTEIALPGYRESVPVVIGNAAHDQRQHGVYGDIFETASRFVASGNILDARSAETLAHLADQCADAWRLPDSGMWELEEQRHYTMSKISCWQALARAVELADGGQLPTTCRDRWSRERDRIADWIDAHCWSETKQAYTFYPGTDDLDASITLAVRFRFDRRDRLRSTLDAIDRDLGAHPYHYRYGGVHKEEGCFLACSFWMIEARALLGDRAAATSALDALVSALDRGVGIYSEMVDPVSGAYLGNLPQGLTHLAVIQALTSLGDDTGREA